MERKNISDIRQENITFFQRFINVAKKVIYWILAAIASALGITGSTNV